MLQPLPTEKRLEWKETILKQQQSGFSAKKWCRQNQLSISGFYYWKKHFFPKPKLSRSSFTEVTHEHKSGICIEYHGVRILLEKEFDFSLLKRCLSALREIRC